MMAILHNIRSLHNVGSIFRTADAAGIDRIYLTGITPAPVDRLGNKRRQIAKVALGAEDFIPWEKKKQVTPLLRSLRQQGCKILAIEQSRKSIPYYKYNSRRLPLNLRGRKRGLLALVVGNEVKGLPKPILKLADKILEIPMYGKKESLNVSVAFGIVAFHLVS